jgi:hypothetical protein
MNKERKSKIAEKLSSFLFYLSILIFLIAFNFQDNKSGGWVQQFIPNTNGVSINDIIFLDSLNGFITHPYHIIRTTNGGTNWFVHITDSTADFTKIQFKGNIGYISCYDKLYKTTNSGDNWFTVPLPTVIWASDDMHVLNKDTLYLTQIALGGLYKSTNGGNTWTIVYNGSNPPDKIYYVDERVGFFGTGTTLNKTTNGGYNFFQLNVDTYRDIHFLDTLYGWKPGYFNSTLMKTTNGGYNWASYNLVPTGNFPGININSSGASRFTLLKRDTIIWCYADVDLTYPNGWTGGYISKSTNGGLNWGFQIPDTSYRNGNYKLYPELGLFTDNNHGWVYCLTNTGVHTSTGGNDTTYYITTGINNQNQNILADNFILYQNYPNPFNQTTNIRYKIKNENGKWKMENGIITIKVFDISGKEIMTLLNKKQSAGEYSVKFDASNLSSGIYFYVLFVDNMRIDAKKTVLIK